MKNKKLLVVYFKSDSGRMPVKEFLQKELTLRERDEVESDISLVGQLGIVGPPLMKPVGRKLWEIRTKLPDHQVRVFCVVENNELVLLHSIIKKTQKTPQDALNLAYERVKIYGMRQGKRS